MNATGEPLGSVCIVLHTHLPWVAHHGAWPVGEEWLHQAWSQSYLPLVDMLTRLGDRGGRDLLTLGMTPVLAAQLDDPYCLREHHTWLGSWQVRAAGLAGMRDEGRRTSGRYEYAAATAALDSFESTWRHGASPVLRRLADAGVIEILGGPLSHAFTPDLDDRWAHAMLSGGLDDAAMRTGHRPRSIWTPECAYRPGLETVWHRCGVDHLMLEGPTLLSAGASTDAPWLLGDSDVLVVGRDLPLAYRVWSPRRGYPGDRWYRDFHTYDHEWGLKIHRVTGRDVPPERKSPYDPRRARVAIQRDAQDFVSIVRDRLLDQRRKHPRRPGLAVVAYDTELFGHWWHEGPAWLEEVLTLLPAAGITPRTLKAALASHDVAGRVHPAPGSWGSGKDFRVWTAAGVGDLRSAQQEAVQRVQSIIDDSSMAGRLTSTARSPQLDQLVTSLLLGLASDWVFMVSKDSAADYARRRLLDHLEDTARIIAELQQAEGAESSWQEIAHRDRPWGHLDARTFASSSTAPR